MNESRYLTVYDYGMGGVWTFIVAPSPDAITEKYPQLEVVSDPPPWMDKARIEKWRVVHLDDADDPFLSSLRTEGRR